jgi:DNA-directed RNA polymerase omega subunit
MPGTDKLSASNSEHTSISAREQAPESRFRLIAVAALRAKQLVRGARPRIETDSARRRNTSIAIEEVRQGLVPFTLMNGHEEKSGGHEHE